MEGRRGLQQLKVLPLAFSLAPHANLTSLWLCTGPDAKEIMLSPSVSILEALSGLTSVKLAKRGLVVILTVLLYLRRCAMYGFRECAQSTFPCSGYTAVSYS